MINPSLPISLFVPIGEILNSPAAQGQNTSTLLILGGSSVIDTQTRMRSYASLTAIATDFGTTAPEYLEAVPWFSQTPQPPLVLIGRWAKTATSGQLYGAPLSAAQQAALITALQAITTGSLTISLDGTSHNLTALNFSAIQNLNGAAAVLQTALAAADAGTTCVWSAAYGQFVITSGTTGATSAVSFATPEGTGIDVSAQMGLQQVAGNGAYVVAGIVAETALAAATLFDQQFGQQWYAMVIAGAADSDHQAVAPFLAATTNKHFYGISTQEAGVLVSTDTTDIAYELMNAQVGKTAVQYNGSSAYSIPSLLAKILTVNWGGSDTALTLAYQDEPGISPDNLNATQFAAMVAKNCNGYLGVNGGTSMLWPGICSNGQWIDTVIGADVLTIQLQIAVFNLMKTIGTKVAQTDPGMHQIKVKMQSVLSQWVKNGFLAAGLPWNGPSFGSLDTGDPLPKGYYIYQPPIASQDPTTRSERISVPFQIAANLAGAVHTVPCTITFA